MKKLGVIKYRGKRARAVAVIGLVGALGLLSLLLTHASSGTPVGNPYIDPTTQLNKTGLSLYQQPWRGYMETVPATKLLNGIGVNYNPGGHDTPAHDDANLHYLASIGVHDIRIEIGWNSISPADETQLTPASAAKLSAIFAACKKYGITPTVLLNANSGGPNPPFPTLTATIIGTPAVGDSVVTVRGVNASQVTVHQPGTSMGASGLSFVNPGYTEEAGNLINKVVTNADGTLTLTLSQPLGTIPTNGKFTISYLKYMPLYAVGTPEFNNTMNGWLQFVKTVTNTVEAAGITNFSEEIWNELTFGSSFLSINNYYPTTAPLYTPTVDFLHPGGST